MGRGMFEEGSLLSRLTLLLTVMYMGGLSVIFAEKYICYVG